MVFIKIYPLVVNNLVYDESAHVNAYVSDLFILERPVHWWSLSNKLETSVDIFYIGGSDK